LDTECLETADCQSLIVLRKIIQN